MKKILSITSLTILSVFALSIFAMPAMVSAADCDAQCAQIYEGQQDKIDDCEKGCDWQSQSDCTGTCRTSTAIEDETACQKGCSLGASPITKISDIENLITAVARWISVIVSVIAVIFIILGGASYITAGGDEDKAGAAKQKIVYGLIGLAIAAVAWGAEALVRSFLKLGQ